MAESKTSNTSAESLITEHLDIWTTAIEQKSSSGRGSSKKFSLHGIKKLRELILELAVRGKLVSQDPNDEPTSVLLERIAAEKAQLVKDKKIKKPKVLPEISEDEKPFELPIGWEWCRLGDFSEVKGGKRLPKGHTLTSTKTDYVYIRVTDMKNGSVKLDDLQYLAEDTQKLISQYTISKEDLYITIAGTIGEIGIVPDELDGMNLTENAAKIVFSLISKLWLKQSLSSSFAMNQFIGKVNQLAQPKLALHRVLSTVTALPPIKEQQRIVTKVDELMGLCDALEAQTENSITAHQTLVEVLLEALLKAPEQTATPEQSTVQFQQNWQRLSEHFDTLFTTTASIDTLKQTILQLAVMGKLVPQNPNDEPAAKLLERIAAEKAQLIKDKKIKKQKPLPEITDEENPFELPQGWEWGRLGDLSSDIHYGYTASAKHNSDGVRLLRITDIQDDKVDWSTVPACEITIQKAQNYLLENDDILIARTGGTIGKSYLVENIDLEAVFASYLIRVRRVNYMYSPFIKVYLGSHLYWRQLYDNASGTGQPNVNATALKGLVIPIPTLDEQHRIAAKVDELMALCDQLKTRLTDAQNTKLHLTDAIVEQAL
tara:strand:- start:5789 stop:7591 length:1803 start_codon:yes stop_codon:yes gene_type:complete